MMIYNVDSSVITQINRFSRNIFVPDCDRVTTAAVAIAAEVDK